MLYHLCNGEPRHDEIPGSGVDCSLVVGTDAEGVHQPRTALLQSAEGLGDGDGTSLEQLRWRGWGGGGRERERAGGREGEREGGEREGGERGEERGREERGGRREGEREKREARRGGGNERGNKMGNLVYTHVCVLKYFFTLHALISQIPFLVCPTHRFFLHAEIHANPTITD